MRMRIVAAVALMIPGLTRAAGFAPQQARAQNVSRNTPTPSSAPIRTIRRVHQGLQFVDGVLYEGTGLNGRSSIRKVELETGEVLQQRDVPAAYFGEGITRLAERSDRAHLAIAVAFVYDRDDVRAEAHVHYPGEGWGLTHDGDQPDHERRHRRLRFLDPATFAERRRVTVTAAGAPVKNLNELEYVKGEIFANVWQTDYIARIDRRQAASPARSICAACCRRASAPSADVLNGIAYDAARRSPVRHRQAVAEAVRDQDRSSRDLSGRRLSS